MNDTDLGRVVTADSTRLGHRTEQRLAHRPTSTYREASILVGGFQVSCYASGNQVIQS